MGGNAPEVAYAKEVYAACATVGFTSAAVARLKQLIDDGGDVGEMMALAQQAQRESIGWAGRSDRS